MRAMRLERIAPVTEGSHPLVERQLDVPRPGPGQVLLRVLACGVCHTELDEIEGRSAPPRLPVTPGHEVVGEIVEGGRRLAAGQRVGVAWIYSACGECDYCRKGLENLCPQFRATGRDADGGYAEYLVVPEDFAYPLPERFSNEQAAPLLCAGAVGYRSLVLCQLQDGQPLGLTGFGASGHLVLQLARRRYPASPVYVFARNPAEREFALQLGASWAGDTAATPPQSPAAIIDTTPAWRPVLEALGHLQPGGRLVINAIRKEAGDSQLLAGLDYPRQLWLEKELKSVANVTRRDVIDFLQLADQAGLEAEVEVLPLQDANRALVEMKTRRIRGAKVLVTDG
ncbi:MAG: alcohol dehydrogenase [Deltaproteobacteria bacterium]|nr:MAG: alcohol dehydrogenase [Deltaproteobacteria bacterium]